MAGPALAQADDWFVPDEGKRPPPTFRAPAPPPLQADNDDDWFVPDGVGRSVAPAASEVEEIPGVFEAGKRGFRRAIQDFSETGDVVSGTQPASQPEIDEGPEAEPIAWSDFLVPGKIGAKLSYGMARSSPTIAGGIAGAGVGATVGGPWGALAGGGVGAGIVTAAQTVGPYYAQALRENPGDPDAAFESAIKQASVDGAISGASWVAFGAAPFKGTVKNLLFQAFGAQPAVVAGGRATGNVLTGRPVGEGVAESIPGAVVGTMVPAVGVPVARKLAEPITSRRQPGPYPRAVAPRPVDPSDNGQVLRPANDDVTQPRADRVPEADDWTVPREAGDDTLIMPSGERIETKPRVVEIDDLIVSHDLEGRANPRYPDELQPRDRSATPSRVWVDEKAAGLEPLRLGRAPRPQEGAPVIGADGVVESGNGRALLLARAYQRHPERADAYRRFLQRQGFDTEGYRQPVLVRERVGDVADRAAFARAANVAATAGFSARERALADAKSLSDDILSMWKPGEAHSVANSRFVRAFADKTVPAEERPQFVNAEGRLSSDGVNRIEAALVAKGWEAPDLVTSLYETPDPTSRAIIGAMADAAPAAARVKAAISEGRLPGDIDPAPALLDAYRLVDRARRSGQKVADMVNQPDMMAGVVPENVRKAVRLFFRDDDLRQPAGRDTVAGRLDAAFGFARDRQNAVRDLFAPPATPDALTPRSQPEARAPEPTRRAPVADDWIDPDTGKPATVAREPERSAAPLSEPPEPPQTSKSNAERAVLNRISQANSPRRWWTWDRFYTSVKDDIHPLKRAVQDLSEGRKVPVDEDPYKLARLTRGAFGKAQHFIDHGTFDFATLRDKGKGLKDILAPFAKDLDGFRAYAVAQRAVELFNRGIETGVPIVEARQTLRQGMPRYGRAFVELQQYQRALIEYLRDSGIIAPDKFDAMVDANKSYVPFFRAADDAAGVPAYGPGHGLPVKNPVRQIKGSKRKIIDPIESIIRNTYFFLSLAERNRALVKLAELAEASPRGEEILGRVRTPTKPIKISEGETSRFLEDHGIDADAAEFTVFRPQAFRPAPDQIALFRQGRREVFEVSRDLGEAVNAMDREAIHAWLRIVSIPARTLRAGAVLAPDFAARNIIRDQLTAFTFSKNGYVPVYTALEGLGSILTKGEAYRRWLKSGGANSALVSLDRRYIDQNIMRLSRDRSLLRSVGNVVRSPLEVLRVMSELAENATRVGEFRKATRRGKSDFEGAFDAREVTLDFQRAGAQTRALNMISAFWNAQVEGLDRTVRAFRERPLASTAKAVAAITLPSVYLWSVNHDDPRYKEIPDWQKDLFWLVMTDKWENIAPADVKKYPKSHLRYQNGQWQYNNGTVWRIPKPFEVGILFGSVPERILDAYAAQDPDAFKGLGQTLAGALIPGFVPTAAQPIIEQFANWNFFTDRPLIPRATEKLEPEYQAGDYASETAKRLGKLISEVPFVGDTSMASPAVIDNYIQAWTGTLGRYTVQGIDKATDAALGVERNRPAATLADRPFIKAFVARYPGADAESIERFYQSYESESRKDATRKWLSKRGYAEGAAKIGPAVALDKIARALGEQRKFVSAVYRDPSMPPEDKRKLIDQTYLQMIELAKTGNAVMRRFEETRP